MRNIFPSYSQIQITYHSMKWDTLYKRGFFIEDDEFYYNPEQTDSGNEEDIPDGKISDIKETAIEDLSNLRFSEIRDFLNTSCDIELLELYRKEFDRRVAKYNTVKNTVKKNENPQTVSQQEKPALPPRNKKRVDDAPTPRLGLNEFF